MSFIIQFCVDGTVHSCVNARDVETGVMVAMMVSKVKKSESKDGWRRDTRL